MPEVLASLLLRAHVPINDSSGRRSPRFSATAWCDWTPGVEAIHRLSGPNLGPRFDGFDCDPHDLLQDWLLVRPKAGQDIIDRVRARRRPTDAYPQARELL